MHFGGSERSCLTLPRGSFVWLSEKLEYYVRLGLNHFSLLDLSRTF